MLSVTRLKRLLWLVVLLSLIPASVLVVRRVGAEEGRQRVTLLADYLSLETQAEYAGLTPFELAERYRALGLNGIALYEETFSSLADRGDIALLLGAQARSNALALGEALPDIAGDSVLVSEITPGALGALLAKNFPEPRRLELAGRDWYVYPGAGGVARPAGPSRALVEQFAGAGWDIAYRPRNFPNLRAVGADYPPEANYLVYFGLQVAGQPDSLSEVVDVSQRYRTAVIEGTEQEGMNAIIRKVPSARLLSFNQDYVNQRLSPADLIDKYLLAANERGVRLMYIRPYTEEQQGDMIANTERLIEGLRARFEAEGYEVAPLGELELDYQTNAWLRGLASLGILAGLGLLALLYPGVWGPLVAAAVLGLGIVANGLDWGALALAAALSFPVIGYGHLKERLTSLGLATLVSLAGAVLLSAVGSDREAMLAITPFAGVAATLVVPPALYLFHYALRYRSAAGWVLDFWTYPIRVGTVAVFLLGAAALALVVLRRGNFPIIGASSAELAFRDWLSSLFVRPRFKEMLGHPLAVLGLAGDWPDWLRALLLTGGVIAQASILNSFSHYHTPFLISLQRTVIALVLGTLLGLVIVPAVRFGLNLGRRWLSRAAVPTD